MRPFSIFDGGSPVGQDCRVSSNRLAAGWLATWLVLTVTLPARAQETTSLTYVALGDSYTAGPLIPDPVGAPAGCGRSARNFPSLVSQRLGYTELVDVSCSGAGTRDFTASQAVGAGEVNAAQLDALHAEVDLVTIGVGGNDIGFAQLATDCVALLPLGSPCQDRFISHGEDLIGARIAQAAPKIQSVLRQAKQRAPQAIILVVGYPSLLPENYGGCWPLMPYAPSDVRYLQEKTQELNEMLRVQAVSGGARFVDTYTPSLGRDACGLPGVRWVEPLLPLAPAAPLHLNEAGMQGIAQQVVQAVD